MTVGRKGDGSEVFDILQKATAPARMAICQRTGVLHWGRSREWIRSNNLVLSHGIPIPFEVVIVSRRCVETPIALQDDGLMSNLRFPGVGASYHFG